MMNFFSHEQAIKIEDETFKDPPRPLIHDKLKRGNNYDLHETSHDGSTDDLSQTTRTSLLTSYE